MKVHYRTRLDDDIDGFISFDIDIPDGVVIPEAVEFGISMLERFIAFDRERVERQKIELRRPSASPAAPHAAVEGDRP